MVVAALDGVDAPLQKSSRIDNAQSFSAIYARATLQQKGLERMESSRHGRAFRHRRGEASSNGRLQPQPSALFAFLACLLASSRASETRREMNMYTDSAIGSKEMRCARPPWSRGSW